MAAVPLEAGSPAPDFSLPDKDGKAHSLSDYRGQKVIVYFYPAASNIRIQLTKQFSCAAV